MTGKRSRDLRNVGREWIPSHFGEVIWELVWDQPNPRRKGGPRDRWWVFRHPLPSREGWPVIWVRSSLLRLRQQSRRQERIARAVEALEAEDLRLCKPRARRKSRTKVQERVDEILVENDVVRYLDVELWQEQLERFRQEHRGRAGPNTRFRREVRRRWRVRWEIDEEAVEFDHASDGMYPLLTNDRALEPAHVLEAHKRQPVIEKRFEQAKTVHEIAPVLLKNEGRIEALFFVYFLALLVQALIERELRTAMQASGTESVPVYPEHRACRRPTCFTVLRLFSLTTRHVLRKDGRTVQTFEPSLTEVQLQTLEFLGVPTNFSL